MGSWQVFGRQFSASADSSSPAGLTDRQEGRKEGRPRMTSAAPTRKPYRKAPPQHRETRHTLPAAAPPPAPQLDINQVNQQTLNSPPSPLQHLTHLPTSAKRSESTRTRHGLPLPPSDSELDVSSLSSLEFCIPPPPFFSSHSRHPTGTTTTTVGVTASDRYATSHKHSPAQEHRRELHSWTHRAQTTSRSSPDSRTLIGSWMPTDSRRKRSGSRTQNTHFPKGILKQPASLNVAHTYDVIRKSKSVEVLDNRGGQGGTTRHQPTQSLERAEQRAPSSRRSSAPSSPSRTDWNLRMQVLEEKVRFSNFLDEITCRVLSPAHLTLLGRSTPQERGIPVPRRRCRSPAHSKQQPEGVERSRRWDNWVAALQQPCSLYQLLQERGTGLETLRQQGDITEMGGTKEETFGGSRGAKIEVQEMEEPWRHKHRPPVSNLSFLSHIKVGQGRGSAFILTLFLHSYCPPHPPTPCRFKK